MTRPAHQPPPPDDDWPPPPADPTPLTDPALVGWDNPVPLGQVHTLPAFPVDVLPGWVADMVNATAVRFQTPADLPGCLALAALSVAAGGRAVVRVRDGWDEEPVNLYTVVIMDPSTRKSPPFRAMTAPLRRAEQELIAASATEREQARITRAAAQRARERAEQEAQAGDESSIHTAVDAALTAADVDVPPVPRLLADDLTPETAANLLARHGGRLAVLSPEGGLFDTLAGRYSGTPNLDIFLKAYSGDTKQVDRIGREPEFIDHPALTIGLTVQPAVIEELSRTRLLRGTGLLARFLYSLPPNTVGTRLSRPPATPKPVTDAYDSRLRGLVKDLAGWTDPAVLQFDPAADDALAGLQDRIEPKLNPKGGEWACIRDWAGKLAGQVVRLAGLLHLATHPIEPWQRPVTADTVTAAALLGEYFTAHALTVFDQMGTDPAVDTARQVLAWIEHHRHPRFTRRDVYRDNRGERVKAVTDIDPVLTVLEDHGHIRLAPGAERAGPGRKPSPTYLVHPDYWRQEKAA